VEDEIVEEVPEQVEVKKKKTGNKKSMSIAEFLARKTENEQQAKLKVCIVQKGDALETLADRYNVPSQQILKVNHLEVTQDIYEGQVLYIPVVPVQGAWR
jgi:stage VI sporulation protein D